MRKLIFIVGLVYSSLEAEAQDNIADTIDLLFNKNRGGALTRSPTKPKPDRSECECVPYYLCTDDSLIVDGVRISDIGEEQDCPSYLEVCCNSSNKTTAPVYPPRKSIEGCGYRYPYGIGFHINGDEDGVAQYGEFPWMAAILAEEFNTNTNSLINVYKCGASLLHPQAVLTAAHCVSQREKKYKVRVGEWDTQTKNELYPHQDRYVKNIVIHNKYGADGFFNDVAILFLDKPVTIGETVNTLCLPEQDIVIPSGTKCVATGWGKDVSGKEGKYQVVLKKIDLPIVDRDFCQEQLRNTTLGDNFLLDKSFVCAGGGGGKNTCKGDDGSPLVCAISGEKDRYQLAGIVSWGVGCGENKVPRVYVNVPMFRHWLDGYIMN